MAPSDVKEVIKVTAAGGPECFMAGAALSRFASTPERVSDVTQQIELIIHDKDDRARLSLITAVSGMESSSCGYLSSFAHDPNADIRSTALVSMTREPAFVSIVLDVLRTDSNEQVKEACLRGFAANPHDEALPDIIKLLAHPKLKYSAHRALVAASDGSDHGWHEPKWEGWLASRKKNK
jgi:hypothetical protein